MNCLDLFSGVGGFHLGLKEAGFKFNWIGYSEIDKYADQIYRKHFPEAEALGDIKTIEPFQLPEIDIITFGFPCQDLSVAGKRSGLHGERSGLFFEALRIIKATTPKIFIFENVKGLLSKNKPWFAFILKEISDIGLYECEWQLLNTRWFLPQNRERIYFIGHLRGAGRPKVFPIGESNEIFTESKGQGKIENQYATAITQNLKRGVHSGGETLVKVGTIGKDAEANRVYSPEGCARTIKNGGGMGAKTGLYEVKPVLTPDRAVKGQNGRRIKEDGEPMFTLTGQDKHGVEMNSRIRRLTPLECNRLQGFPDNWTDGVSDTQKYKCIGNAVSVPVVKEIGRRLLNG